MKPAPFVHHAPRSVDEAVAVLAQVGHDGKVLAGGQSLIPILNMRLASPAHLVDINQVCRASPTCRHRHRGAGRCAGAARAARAPRRRVCRPAAAAPGAGQRRPSRDPQPGHHGRSIAHADAAGEMPAMLALTDGVVEAVSAARRPRDRGRRLLRGRRWRPPSPPTSWRWPCGSAASPPAPARRSWSGPVGTATTPWPASRPLCGSRTASSPTPGCRSCPSPTCPGPVDVTAAFAGQEPGAVDWSAAADLVHGAIEPDGDIHATAAYRAMLAVELSRLTLAEAAARPAALQQRAAPARARSMTEPITAA